MCDQLYVILDIDFKQLKKEYEMNNILKYDPTLTEPIGMDNGDTYSILTNDVSSDKKETIIAEYDLEIGGKKIASKVYKTESCGNCWWCCHSFDNIPVFIPTRYHKDTDVFDNYGNFCSFNCALSYNYNNAKTVEYIERESLIYLLYKKTSNISFDQDFELQYAPDKEVLIMFGGNIDINTYRQNNKIFNIIYPPMSHIVPDLEEFSFVGIEEEPLYSKKRENVIEDEEEKSVSKKKQTTNKKQNSKKVQKQQKSTLDSYF